MDPTLFEAVQTSSGETTLVFHSSLDYDHAPTLWEELYRFLQRQHPQSLTLDFKESPVIDSAGIALLRLLQQRCRENRIALHYQAVPSSAEYFFHYIQAKPSVPEGTTPPPKPSFIDSLGQLLLDQVKGTRSLIRFLGDFVLSSAHSLRSFRRFRWREMLYYAQLSGSDAMPIVFLLSFLIGMVMAFQAAVQLRQFGANIFVADLVSLALTRELGPIFTAIILAGRSGSAFAAEIGTMKVNEEVDALNVMGFNTIQFLVLPKVFALMLCGPLLTLLANASGILGGMVVGITSLELTAYSFLEETYLVLSLKDVGSGLIKSVVFAVLVALIGCFRGLEANKGADSVGRQTTSAVVSGIFLIIFFDAIFTVLFHIFDW